MNIQATDIALAGTVTPCRQCMCTLLPMAGQSTAPAAMATRVAVERWTGMKRCSRQRARPDSSPPRTERPHAPGKASTTGAAPRAPVLESCCFRYACRTVHATRRRDETRGIENRMETTTSVPQTHEVAAFSLRTSRLGHVEPDRWWRYPSLTRSRRCLMLNARNVARRSEHYAPGQTTVVVFCLVWWCDGAVAEYSMWAEAGRSALRFGGRYTGAACALPAAPDRERRCLQSGKVRNRVASTIPSAPWWPGGTTRDDRDGRGVESGRFRCDGRRGKDQMRRLRKDRRMQ